MIVAYLKPTNFCNVDCDHCYLPKEVRADKSKMSDETLHKTMSFLKEMSQKNNNKQIFLIWHGGEPLILSSQYFENAGKIIDQYFTKEQLVEGVQTSLIPYTKDKAQLVKTRWSGSIGSSIDFNSRLIKGSVAEYQKLWLSKVDLAREDGILVLPGMVPNKKDCLKGKEIFDWFKERDFWYWNIDRYSNISGTTPEFSSNREHSKFLIDLFDSIIDSIHKTGYSPYVKPVAAGIGGVLFDTPGDRWGGSCQSDFIVINPNGKLNSCPDRDSFEDSMGSLHLGYSSFAQSPLRKKWIRIQQSGHRIDECYNCENASFCKSGCPITENACTRNGEKDECSGFKSFLTHVRNFVKQSEENRIILQKYISYEFMPQKIDIKINESN